MKHLRNATSTLSGTAASPLMRLSACALAGLLLAGLSACGEKSQNLGPQTPGTTVSRDTKAYDGEASKFALTTFKRGDKAAWETQMRTRMQGQDEYSREK